MILYILEFTILLKLIITPRPAPDFHLPRWESAILPTL